MTRIITLKSKTEFFRDLLYDGYGPGGLWPWVTRSKTLLDKNNIIVTKYSNTQSKQVSRFTPNATIYNIKRIESGQTKLKENE